MPRPLSTTETELSGWIVDRDRVAVPGERLVDGVVDHLVDEVVQAASPVEPMYMPGRLRTASRPSRTVMSWAS